MNQLRVLYHLMRADFIERVRGYGFLAMLLFTVFLTYLFIPAPESIQVAGLALGGARAIYNSAWIGSLTTLLMGEFFLLFAFYLLKGSIERDRRTGVGQIIAATPISKPMYTLGKWLCNVAVMAAMVTAIIVAAGMLQFMRGEDLHPDIWALASPFLIVLLPALAVVAAVAVLFDSINLLRGGLGNVIFFFVAYPALYLLLDLPGNTIVYPSIYRACAAHFSDCQPVRQIDAGMAPLAGLPTFHYEGVLWTTDVIMGRLGLVLLGAAIALLAAWFFHRFDPTRADRNLLGRLFDRMKQAVLSFVTASVTADQEHVTLAPTTDQAHPSPQLTKACPASSRPRLYWQMLIAEMRLTFKGVSRLWYLGAVILIAASWLVPGLKVGMAQLAPVDVAHLIVLPLAWVWPVTVWSNLGAREVRHRVEPMVFSAPHPLLRQLPITWLVGVFVALVMASGVMAQLAWSGQWVKLLALCVGGLFIPTLALALGCWSGGSKLFEGTYLFLWYVASTVGGVALDYMGRVPAAISGGIPWMYAGLTILLMAAAVMGRQRQIKR
jgi:hypothetical protein